MKRWRIAMVMLLVAFLMIGHGIDIWAMREHWPFSFYPMYARIEKKPRLVLMSAFGLMREPGYRALVWLTDPKYVPPIGEGRLRVILMAAYRRGDKPENIENTKRVLADYMRLYEARRVAGLHDGPRMTEISLYRRTWKLRPDGTHRTKPWKSEELVKVTAAELARPWRLPPGGARPAAPVEDVPEP